MAAKASGSDPQLMLVGFSPTRVTASPKPNNRENGTVNLVKNLQ